VLGMSSRRTLSGEVLGSTATANATFVAPVSKRFDVIATARNLFDVQYSDPASDQHLQDTIPENGRTIRVGLRLKFAAR
jgi:outer membrane receptor protein involved in Fe transport